MVLKNRSNEICTNEIRTNEIHTNDIRSNELHTNKICIRRRFSVRTLMSQRMDFAENI